MSANMGARVRFLAMEEWLLSNSMKRSKCSGKSSGREQCVSVDERGREGGGERGREGGR